MFQFNEFPRNILAALDALAELGKAVQNKIQPSELRPARLQREFTSSQEKQIIHKVKDSKKRGKA